MTIRQLNVTHDDLEDRLLLKITSEDAERRVHEFRLWLTRARTLWLVAQVDRSVVATLQQQHAPERAEQIASFQQQALADASDFSAPFVEAPSRPLGDAPQLVHHMQLTWGGAQCVWQLQLHTGACITLTLAESLMAQTRLLLQQISERAGWLGASTAMSPRPVGAAGTVH